MSLFSSHHSAASRQRFRRSLFNVMHTAPEQKREIGLLNKFSETSQHKRPCKDAGWLSTKGQSFESHFVQCLVRAGKCREDGGSRDNISRWRQPVQQRRLSHTNSRLQSEIVLSSHRSRATRSDKPVSDGPIIPRDELKGLLDYYLEPHEPEPSPPSVNTEEYQPSHRPALPTLHGPGRGSNTEPHEDNEIVRQLESLLSDSTSSHEAIQSVYDRLSWPRILHLPESVRHRLLHTFSFVERKPSEMLRFLNLISEVRDAGLTLNVYEWTTATYFTARYLRLISDLSVEKAFLVWKEMESQAGIRSNSSTMTVLLNIAMKSRKFVLAEVILEEVERRNLEKHLHFRTSLIFYKGLRCDSQGVRRAYQELVDAGEIVSTAVISCVISALLLCGEPAAAEHVFERAKRLHLESSQRPLPPSDWQTRRLLGKTLEKTAHDLRNNESARVQYQTGVAIFPGVEAYRALIKYHSIFVGDWDRSLRFIGEMHAYGIAITGGILIALIRAFSIHGGIIYTSWTSRRLEEVWTAFMKAQDDGVTHCTLNVQAVRHIIKAFAKCASIARAREVWDDQILERWTASEEEKTEVKDLLSNLADSPAFTSIDDESVDETELIEDHEQEFIAHDSLEAEQPLS